MDMINCTIYVSEILSGYFVCLVVKKCRMLQLGQIDSIFRKWLPNYMYEKWSRTIFGPVWYNCEILQNYLM